MKLSLVFASTIFLSCLAQAGEAAIFYGNVPLYGHKMVEISDSHGKHRVSGRLRDLETSGGGEDEEFVLACFSGKPQEVCNLLETAVAEENEKENRKGKKLLELQECELTPLGNLSIDVRSESRDEIRLQAEGLPPCRKIKRK